MKTFEEITKHLDSIPSLIKKRNELFKIIPTIKDIELKNRLVLLYGSIKKGINTIY